MPYHVDIPFVSVVLPVHNEVLYIQRSLGAVLSQNYPPNRMEILIIDGVSSDGTCEFIAELASRHLQFTVRILDNPGQIVPIGLNIALSQARGEIIVRVDGHCVIARDYIRNCVKHIQNDRISGVGGPMHSIGETYISKALAIGMSSAFGVGNSAFRTLSGKSILADTVPFPAYTRQIIERAGLYDEELVRNQDDEYNYRIREMGGKILLAGDVCSTYFSRGSLKSLWYQYYQYGYWKVRVFQKHPRQMRPRQFVPPLFVSALLTSLLLALFISMGRWVFVLITGLYLLTNLTASVWEASRRGWRYLPLLPVVFSILHISYGLGFLVGLVRFAHRWGDKLGKTPAFSNDHV